MKRDKFGCEIVDSVTKEDLILITLSLFWLSVTSFLFPRMPDNSMGIIIQSTGRQRLIDVIEARTQKIFHRALVQFSIIVQLRNFVPLPLSLNLSV